MDGAEGVTSENISDTELAGAGGGLHWEGGMKAREEAGVIPKFLSR